MSERVELHIVDHEGRTREIRHMSREEWDDALALADQVRPLIQDAMRRLEPVTEASELGPPWRKGDQP